MSSFLLVLTEYHFLAFWADVGNYLFPLSSGKIWESVLGEHAILIIFQVFQLYLYEVLVTAERAEKIEYNVSFHFFTSFQF